MHSNVGQALELFHQHGVRLELGHEFDNGHMAHHAGQINRGLHAGIAAANHGDILALEQGAIAVRAIRHALVLVLGLTRHVDIAPARAGGQDHGLGLECAAVGQLHLDQATGLRSRNELVGTLQIHDVHVIGAGVRFQRSSEFGAIGFQHRDVVLNRQCVVHLATKALGSHTGTDAFARGVYGSGSASRTTADDEHVVGCLV